jgi:subtilisin family serine protease
MRTKFVAACLVCLLGAVNAQAQGGSYAANQLILSFQDKSSSVMTMSEGRIVCMFPSVLQILEDNGMTSMRRLYSGDKGAQNIYLIELSSDENVDSAIDELRDDSAVLSASRNFAIELLTEPTDWYFNHDYYPPGDPDGTEDQWYLKVMQADKAWDVERGSPGVTIGILDTGIDFFHQDLESNIWVNPGEDLDQDGAVWDVADLDSVDNDGNGLVDDLVGWNFKHNSIGDNYPYPGVNEQHGTMMSSVGAAASTELPHDTSIAGISWHCKLVPLKM